MDPKTQVNQFLQKYCKRPITKGDLVYETANVGGGFQSTVTINALGGDQFVGEPAPTSKEAEKAAAVQVLAHYEAEIAELSSLPKAKKQKTSGGFEGGAGVVAPPEPVVPAPVAMGGMVAAQAGVSAGNATSAKSELNTCCMKILRRVMQKGEIVYDTAKVQEGHQCTVSVPCLPGEYAGVGFTGEVCANAKDAEQSAASYAVEAITADPELQASMSAPSSAKVKQAQKNREHKGAGKGKFGKGKFGKKGPNPNFMHLQQMMMEG